jgi:chromosome segregation ATPase
MASLADQIAEMEDDLAYERDRANGYAERIDSLDEQLSDIEEEIESLRDFAAWVKDTYPDAELAYSGKRRLDQAGVGGA